jgi:uncharacterized protein YueI
MDFKAEVMKELKEQLEKEGASKHDIAVTLAFNDTVLENIIKYVNNLDNPVMVIHSLRVMSKLMLIVATQKNLFGNQGDTNNDNNNRR